MTAQEVAKLLAVQGMLWPTMTPARDQRLQVEVVLRVLDGVTYAEAEAALIEHSRGGATFPPPPGAVMQTVLQMREVAAGTAAPDPDEALRIVMRQVQRRGARGVEPKQWRHPAIAAAVAAIGWKELCLSTNPEATRAHFLRLYESARTRTVGEQRRSPQARAVIEGLRQGLSPGALGALDRPAE